VTENKNVSDLSPPTWIKCLYLLLIIFFIICATDPGWHPRKKLSRQMIIVLLCFVDKFILLTMENLLSWCEPIVCGPIVFPEVSESHFVLCWFSCYTDCKVIGPIEVKISAKSTYVSRKLFVKSDKYSNETMDDCEGEWSNVKPLFISTNLIIQHETCAMKPSVSRWCAHLYIQNTNREQWAFGKTKS